MEKENQLRIVTSQHGDWPLSFKCPEVWELKQTPMRKGVKFFLRGPLNQAETLFASITVRARPGEGQTLPQLAHEWIERRSAFRTFRLLARTETDLAGGDAIQLDAAHEMPLPLGSPRAQMITVRERVVFALSGERIYELCYRAVEEDFEEHLPVFEALAASFSLDK